MMPLTQCSCGWHPLIRNSNRIDYLKHPVAYERCVARYLYPLGKAPLMSGILFWDIQCHYLIDYHPLFNNIRPVFAERWRSRGVGVQKFGPGNMGIYGG